MRWGEKFWENRKQEGGRFFEKERNTRGGKILEKERRVVTERGARREKGEFLKKKTEERFEKEQREENIVDRGNTQGKGRIAAACLYSSPAPPTANPLVSNRRQPPPIFLPCCNTLEEEGAGTSAQAEKQQQTLPATIEKNQHRLHCSSQSPPTAPSTSKNRRRGRKVRGREMQRNRGLRLCTGKKKTNCSIPAWDHRRSAHNSSHH